MDTESEEMRKVKQMVEGSPSRNPSNPPDWPSGVNFDPEIASKTGLTLSSLPLRTRVILGMFKNRAFHKKKYKELIITALDEYLQNHQNEFNNKEN